MDNQVYLQLIGRYGDTSDYTLLYSPFLKDLLDLGGYLSGILKVVLVDYELTIDNCIRSYIGNTVRSRSTTFTVRIM